MERKNIVKLTLIGLLTLFCAMYILPSLVAEGSLPKWYTDVFSQKLNYGLDLKGGLELRYAVDYKKAIADNILKMKENVSKALVDAMAEKEGKDPETLPEGDRKTYAKRFTIERIAYDTLSVVFTDPADAQMVTGDFVTKKIDPMFRRVVISDNEVHLIVKDERIEQIKKDVVEQTLSIIRKRVDSFGLVEPDVRKNGETNIDLQLPGVGKDQMDLVRERLGQTAQLVFRIVDHTSNFFADKQDELLDFLEARKAQGLPTTIEMRKNSGGEYYLTGNKKSELIAFVKTLPVPEDRMVGYEEIIEKDGATITAQYYKTHYLESKSDLSGDHLTRAYVAYDQQGIPYVSLEFDSVGAKIFEKLTEEHEGEDMAIMLDEDVNSAPRIKEVIRGGRAQITLGGNRSNYEILSEAQGLVTVLTHGAYKAPVHKIHDFEVGPSLGQDAIDAAKLALSVGAVLVILFMLIYYKGSGIIATVALTLNVIYIFAILVSFNSALTLPGMAGIILTIGMAVDANVIIYERIREELRAGKTPRIAVDTGYSKAFWTIFDANITTALTAIILLNFTSGPIYGFAVTLLAGIVCSMFTAIVVTRLIFNALLSRKNVETLSI